MGKILDRHMKIKADHMATYEGKRSDLNFYLTFSNLPKSFIKDDKFIFKFGITDSIERRVRQHNRAWGAEMKFTLYLNTAEQTIIKWLESKVSQFSFGSVVGQGRSEFRKGLGAYKRIILELIEIAEECPEQKIKFFLPSNEPLFRQPFELHFRHYLFKERMQDNPRFLYLPNFLVEHSPFVQ